MGIVLYNDFIMMWRARGSSRVVGWRHGGRVLDHRGEATSGEMTRYHKCYWSWEISVIAWFTWLF